MPTLAISSILVKIQFVQIKKGVFHVEHPFFDLENQHFELFLNFYEIKIYHYSQADFKIKI
ncbi:hypothetical protein TUM3794_13270 [Shewanella colwelliana]|uniref:Uncharacterized protein n=1 Tax=Shewanella colwelliana TaxID=23 RepID=A0ABQ4NXG0_SHECO|nr:hypothetical protein TUM3794_13270 [Shewanella colwelliana]